MGDLEAPRQPTDILKPVLQRESTPAARECDARPRLPKTAGNRCADETPADPEPDAIGVFDDLLTTDWHFQAMKAVLHVRRPTGS